MKIIQLTLTRLSLQERPIPIWIISIVTAALGLLIFIAFESPVDYFGLFCIFCANFMMFGSPVKTCIFDKTINQVILKQKGWMGKQSSSYYLDKINSVKVEELELIGTQFYRVILTLESGDKFYLTKVPSTDKKLQQKIASYIRQFLNHRHG